MICESIIHCIGNSRPEFEFRIHLSPTLWSYCVIYFWTVLWSKILSITIFKSFSGVNGVLFSQFKSSSASIVDAMISILRVIMWKIFTVYSNFWKVTISVYFFWQLFIKIFFRINHNILYFCFWLHDWSSLLLNLLCRTIYNFCKVLY